MKFEKRELIKGEAIVILSPDMKKKLGVGKYVRDENLMIGNKGSACLLSPSVPVFKLGRKLIRGIECWWIPEKEAKIIKKQIQKEYKENTELLWEEISEFRT